MMLCIVWDGGPEHVKEEHLLCMPPLFSPLQPNGCLETFMAFTNMIIGQFSFCDKNMELCQGKYQHLAVEVLDWNSVRLEQCEIGRLLERHWECVSLLFLNFYACSTDIKIIWDYYIISVNWHKSVNLVQNENCKQG